MKILFIHKQNFMFFGVLTLAGYLKKNGHNSDVLIDIKEKNIISKISASNPDIIGFSVMSNDYEWFIHKAKQIKNAFPEKLIIIGGTHAYLCPELIEFPFIDIVCIGEGEKPLLNLMNALEAGKEYYNIKSLYTKINNKIIRNELDAPISNLDEISEDRNIYMNRYTYFKNENLLQIISSRGCPLSCTFCINEKINELYKNISAKYHRQKSPEFLISETKNLLKNFPKISTVFFPDDLFLADKKFVRKFTKLYKNEIGLPYLMNVFPFYIDDEIAKLLADSNCKTIMIAPETGNEEHRFKIFKKKIKNEQFINMALTAKKYGLNVYSTAIFIYPQQTIDDVYSTIELHHKIKVDYPFKSFLQPYPHTEIFNIAVENKNIPPDFNFKDLPQSYFLKSALDHPQKKEILLIYNFYYFFIIYPAFYNLIKNRLYILKFIPFKKLINYWGIFLWFKNWKNMNYFNAFTYMLRFWKDR